MWWISKGSRLPNKRSKGTRPFCSFRFLWKQPDKFTWGGRVAWWLCIWKRRYIPAWFMYKSNYYDKTILIFDEMIVCQINLHILTNAQLYLILKSNYIFIHNQDNQWLSMKLQKIILNTFATSYPKNMHLSHAETFYVNFHLI